MTFLYLKLFTFRA